MSAGGAYRALIAITTCNRLPYLKRLLPQFAAFTVADARFSLVVSLDGDERDTRRFCEEWEIPLVWSSLREGVGLAKNRVLECYPDFDFYFFLEDDVELLDGAVFPAHIKLFETSGIHHFALQSPGGARKRLSESFIAGHRVVHCLYGGAGFAFFTGDGLRQVGGWHPNFAEYRRFGHTEHSYRFVRAGLAPAPFNVAEDLTNSCIWHVPPAVTKVDGMTYDEDQVAAPERALMAQELTYVPVQTLSPVRSNGVCAGPLTRLGITVDRGERYPLLRGVELRHARADYQLWRSRAGTGPRRAVSFGRAALGWPGNPALRHVVKTALVKR